MVNRPRVTLCGVASLDGKITVAPGVLLLYGDERWTAVSGTSNVVEWLRFTHEPQAFLEGSNSLVAEGEEPGPLPPFAGDPHTLYEDYLPENILRRPGHKGWFGIVDGRGRVRLAYKEYPAEEWKGWYALILTARRAPPEYLAYLRREEIPYLIAGEERVDLRAALEKMESLLGVERVLSSSPGKLGGALLRAGLVDEIDVELFPAVIGGSDTPGIFGGPALAPGEWPVRLKLHSAQVYGDGRVWLRYEVPAQG